MTRGPGGYAMFIRWQKRSTRSAYGKHDIGWSAVLLQPIRIDGKPRQRYIAYITGIRQSGIDQDTAHQRCWFWDRVLERLHQLSNKVGEEDCKRIIATIAKKVPMPTREEYEFCHRHRYELLGIDAGPLPEHGLYELPANFLDTTAG
jgi:hypothetical protein